VKDLGLAICGRTPVGPHGRNDERITTMRADGITDRSQDAADIRNATAARRDPNPGSRGDRRQEWCQFTRDGPVDVRYHRCVKVLSHPHHPGQRRLAPEFAYLIQ
jgi:hypothetical protein